MVRWKPLIHQSPLLRYPSIHLRGQHKRAKPLPPPFVRCCSRNPSFSTSSGLNLGLKPDSGRNQRPVVEAKAAQSPPLSEETDVIFSEKFNIERIKKVFWSSKRIFHISLWILWLFEFFCDHLEYAVNWITDRCEGISQTGPLGRIWVKVDACGWLRSYR
jgi:hypothetical protein